MDEKARKQDPRPESGFRKRPALHYSLKARTGEFPIVKLETTIGRSASCDVVLESALVSRRHARLLLSDSDLFLEDLGSRNGVIVNTALVRGSARLSVGDRIRIGPEILEIVERPATSASTPLKAPGHSALEPLPGVKTLDGLEGTAKASDLGDLGNRADSASELAGLEDPEDPTHRADVLELLGNAVGRLLTSGKAEEAERLVGIHLATRLDEANRKVPLPPDMTKRAGRLAIKLAAATEKASWLDYPVALYRALAQPMPLPLVDEMYTLIRKIPGINRAQLREYVSLLHSQAERFNAEERFALQRVEGLERLAGI